MSRSLLRTAAPAAALLLLAACGGGADAPDPAPAAQCAVAADCGADTACRVRTCVAGACGTSDLPAGTVVLAQTAGDCQENRCDGAGGVTAVALSTDVPADDGNACTLESCSSGTPVHPPAEVNTTCTQNGGSFCDGAGSCVECNAPDQCPGQDGECATRTCVANACDFDYQPDTVAVSAQTAGDCKENRCDGAGGVTAVPVNGDVADDGNQCTFDLCELGVPTHPNKIPHRPCDQNGGNVCDGNGACVGCVSAGDCPGVDTECRTRTCVDNACDASLAPDDTPISSQTAGDCRENRCAGGEIVSAALDTDLPVDGIACTADACTAGVPSNPPAPVDTACSQDGGAVCNATAACVQCNDASQCPPAPSECVAATCSAAGACGTRNEPEGQPTPTQSAGDCEVLQCDGNGGVVAAVDDADVPADDGNSCTTETCSNGIPMQGNAPDGTPCGGGGACGGGVCLAPPQLVASYPADGASAGVPTALSLTFSTPMNVATLTAQTTAGACTGSVQLSKDGFASCAAFAAAAPSVTATNTYTWLPAPGLLVNRTYKLRVTTGAASSAGVPLAAPHTMPAGFQLPNTAAPSGIVISQVYGAGGNTGAVYQNDFVELHNRGTTPVSLAGWSIQYAAATGTSTWLKNDLPAVTVPSGGYFLVKLGGSAAFGAPLPAWDHAPASAALSLSGTAGKVALVSNTTALVATPAAPCPVSAGIVDRVHYGATNCPPSAPQTSSVTAAFRLGAGCTSTGNLARDFTIDAPAPRSAVSPPFVCSSALNESNAALEADHCVVQWPPALNAQAGTGTELVYGRLHELGATEAFGPAPGVAAALGYGPASANPETDPGWTWVDAWFNVDVGNDDEFMAQLSAPAAGVYRYAFRFSLDAGATWTYCDANGAGASAGLTFDLEDLPVMTVTP